MHCTFPWLHGTSSQLSLQPCTQQSVSCTRNCSGRQRRCQLLGVYCVADVVPTTETSAVVRLDDAVQVPSTNSGWSQSESWTQEQPSVCAGTASFTAAHKASPAVYQQQAAAAPQEFQKTLPFHGQPDIESENVRFLATTLACSQQQRTSHKHRGRRRKKHEAAKHGNSTQSGNSCSNSKLSVNTTNCRRKPVDLLPCERGAVHEHADKVSKLLLQGQHARLTVGSGMQVSRSLAALASARTLMLSTSSTAGLVFQPVLQNQLVGVASSTTAAAAKAEEWSISNSQHTERISARQSLCLYTCRINESQLRRHEQNQLIASRYGSSSKLAAAAFARVCQQGYTAVRAAGPDAVRVALLAVTATRQKLLPYGLDIAVVPATEFVDVDNLPQQSDQQSVEYESGDAADAGFGYDDSSRQFVQVTVLHIMRCQIGKPWKLLPQRVPYDQLPATVWQQRQLKAQQKVRECQQTVGAQPSVALETAVQQEEEQHYARLQQPVRQHVEQDTVAHHEQQQEQQLQDLMHLQHDEQQRWQPTSVLQSQEQRQHYQHPAEQANLELRHLTEAVDVSAGASVITGSDNCADKSDAGYGWSSSYPAVAASKQGFSAVDAAASSYNDASHRVFTSGNSIDGSIWCQFDDPEYAAVHVGEGSACADDDVEVLWLQGTSTAHSCSSKHPSQLLLLQKQKREKASKRQLVAAAQRAGQCDAGPSSCNN